MCNLIEIKMKKIFYILFITSTFLLGGCSNDDLLELNKNPNNVLNPPIDNVFLAAFVVVACVVVAVVAVACGVVAAGVVAFVSFLVSIGKAISIICFIDKWRSVIGMEGVAMSKDRNGSKVGAVGVGKKPIWPVGGALFHHMLLVLVGCHILSVTWATDMATY